MVQDATWLLWDYIDNRGENLIKNWTLEELQKVEKNKLRAKLDMLRRQGPGLLTGLLTDTRSPRIKELCLYGNRAIRLLLCRGPVDDQGEFTLLFGAFERDREYVPSNAIERAEQHLRNVEHEPLTRRCPHERVY